MLGSDVGLSRRPSLRAWVKQGPECCVARPAPVPVASGMAVRRAEEVRRWVGGVSCVKWALREVVLAGSGGPVVGGRLDGAELVEPGEGLLEEVVLGVE
ncbi:MAG: hypothetical protein AMXMBFR64_08830 [Myxococcales bacterium]